MCLNMILDLDVNGSGYSIHLLRKFHSRKIYSVMLTVVLLKELNFPPGSS